MQGKPQPIPSRPRSSSFDAPHQMSPPNQPGQKAALVQSIPSEDQIDGVAERASFTAPRQDTRASSPTQIINQHAEHEDGSSTTSAAQPFTSPYGNPSLNASAPVLANPSSVQMNVRSVTGPLVKRKISFAANLSVHTTWPGTIYDRRAEPSTCNKLTPTLAQQIKEELNAFKMEEMEVVSRFSCSIVVRGFLLILLRVLALFKPQPHSVLRMIPQSDRNDRSYRKHNRTKAYDMESALIMRDFPSALSQRIMDTATSVPIPHTHTRSFTYATRYLLVLFPSLQIHVYSLARLHQYNDSPLSRTRLFTQPTPI